MVIILWWTAIVVHLDIKENHLYARKLAGRRYSDFFSCILPPFRHRLPFECFMQSLFDILDVDKFDAYFHALGDVLFYVCTVCSGGQYHLDASTVHCENSFLQISNWKYLIILDIKSAARFVISTSRENRCAKWLQNSDSSLRSQPISVPFVLQGKISSSTYLAKETHFPSSRIPLIFCQYYE